jgi:hypothetical protein
VSGASEIDTSNGQMVGVREHRIVVQFPWQVMTPAEALRHAAWLVALAEGIDADLHFSKILEAVRNT